MTIAKIKWLTQQEGGRNQIPDINHKIYPMIKLENNIETFNWSLELINIKEINPFETIAEIKFLMPNAPHTLLINDSKFTLHEGAKTIGTGIIIPNEI